jgi:hypothetical protein
MHDEGERIEKKKSISPEPLTKKNEQVLHLLAIIYSLLKHY